MRGLPDGTRYNSSILSAVPGGGRQPAGGRTAIRASPHIAAPASSQAPPFFRLRVIILIRHYAKHLHWPSVLKRGTAPVMTGFGFQRRHLRLITAGRVLSFASRAGCRGLGTARGASRTAARRPPPAARRPPSAVRHPPGAAGGPATPRVGGGEEAGVISCTVARLHGCSSLIQSPPRALIQSRSVTAARTE